MDAEDFSITNPSWQNFMDKTVKRAQNRTHLYMMLLYGKGDHFKPHQDSEKERDMFGTLVICLPAPYTVVDVIAQLGDPKRTFRTSECSKSCLFWYSDVQHEVTEVMAGHRLALTYNLIRPEWGLSSGLRQENLLLKKTLESWRKACNREDFWRKHFFVFPFEHQHSLTNLGFHKLKGKDLAQARALQNHCEASGLISTDTRD
ncbi:hypothetical protein BKA81DRAFT_427492 [Phyllosticta paracitricarpa]